eukprot:UN07353
MTGLGSYLLYCTTGKFTRDFSTCALVEMFTAL